MQKLGVDIQLEGFKLHCNLAEKLPVDSLGVNKLKQPKKERK